MPKTTAKSKPAVDKLDFEQAMAELEALVAEMEGGELSLEDSLARFERGVALSRRGETLLTAAEQRVQLLQKRSAEDGGDQLTDFDRKDGAE